MKALTLTQPWATLVAIGAKKIETRSWSTPYRGPLAIHAAKRIPKEHGTLWLDEPFLGVLHSAGIVSISPSDLLAVFGGGTKYQLHADKLHLGCVLATCELLNCIKIQEEQHLCRRLDPAIGPVLPSFFPMDDLIWIPPSKGNEFAFGDYTPGRFAWLLANVKLLPEPIPARGALGLWDWDEQG